MEIAKPIQTLEYLRDSGAFPFSTKEGVLYTVESIVEAIDTMRKYEKIQEIIKQKEYENFNTHNYFGCFLRVQDIRKVIQYGNDD